MSNEFSVKSDVPSGASSVALLALKRFVRGTFQRVSLALVSLILMLNLTAPTATSHHATALNVAAHPVPTQQLFSSTEVPSAGSRPSHFPAESVADTSINASMRAPTDGLNASSRPVNLLRSSLTHHRLTSARLLIPSDAERSAVAAANHR
ncbi:MAG: hypothetical protein ACFB16_15095 [Phormidesmis sp.]